MPSKYDTNPLDPDFPEKARAEAAAAETRVFSGFSTSGETTRFAETGRPAEDATRRFSEADTAQYQRPFDGAAVPEVYAGAAMRPFVDTDDPARKVAKIGLPENMVTAIPYIPWYIGLIGGLILLAILPKSETKARFHAAQGLAAHIGILIISSLLGFGAKFTDLASAGNMIFLTVTTIMLIVFAVKAWRGKPVHIESVDDLTNWLEEKISPKTVGTK